MKNGSGWESNPPDHFSAVSLGLKPRAVSPQPVERQRNCDKGGIVVGRLVGRDSHKSPEIDPDLACLIAAWPTLPEPIKRAILGILDSAHAQGG